MRKAIISTVTICTLSAALIGCGFSNPETYTDKNGMTYNVKPGSYDGRVVSDRDLVVYRKSHRHVFTYDGVRYKVKPHHGKYVYYRV